MTGQQVLDLAGFRPSGWLVCRCRALVRAGHACPACGKRFLKNAEAKDLEYVRKYNDDPALVAIERRLA